jgi:endonuclease-3
VDIETANQIYDTLYRSYPRAGDAVRHRAPPFQILILTILSAQTTDNAVDQVAGPLFRRYPTPEALASAQIGDVERIIHSTGFFHVKARHITGAAQKIVQEFDGSVPATMEELLTLPGVGRKTANIVLYHAFGLNRGVAVDTHVFRLAKRIGFSDGRTAEGIEADLARWFPADRWGTLTDLLISHGRTICTARDPRCGKCPINTDCRYYHEVFVPSHRSSLPG